MPEIIVVARKGIPNARVLYLNKKLFRMGSVETIKQEAKLLEQALGVKSRVITIKGNPHNGERPSRAWYRLALAYLRYRATCTEKRRRARIVKRMAQELGLQVVPGHCKWGLKSIVVNQQIA